MDSSQASQTTCLKGRLLQGRVQCRFGDGDLGTASGVASSSPTNPRTCSRATKTLSRLQSKWTAPDCAAQAYGGWQRPTRGTLAAIKLGNEPFLLTNGLCNAHACRDVQGKSCDVASYEGYNDLSDGLPQSEIFQILCKLSCNLRLACISPAPYKKTWSSSGFCGRPPKRERGGVGFRPSRCLGTPTLGDGDTLRELARSCLASDS